VEEAVQQLVAFGVWRSRASQLVRELDLTPETVSRACAALGAEAGRGTRFANPPALLVSRLEAGWLPPEVEPRGNSVEAGEWEYRPPPPERAPLPQIADAQGQSWDAYEWFEHVKRELKLQLLSETFEMWLHDAQLADYRPAEGERPGALTVRLRNQCAHEWVSRRLHKIVQRLVDEMSEREITVEYSVPPEEPDRATGEDVAEPARQQPSNGVYTLVYTPCIQMYTREVRA
jgi:hypothetical protein